MKERMNFELGTTIRVNGKPKSYKLVRATSVSELERILALFVGLGFTVDGKITSIIEKCKKLERGEHIEIRLEFFERASDKSSVERLLQINKI